jgi:ABC-2 type transport system permease protein
MARPLVYPRSVFSKTLYDLRWTLLAFCVGLGLLSFFILYIYPSVADTQNALLQGMSPEVAKSIGLVASPKGFLSLQMFSFQPLYLAVFLIIATSAAVAGEEGENTLGQLLARPIPRWRILTEKALAIVVGVVAITLATMIGAVVGAWVAGVDISLRDLAWSIANTAPFGLWLVGFGLFCSAVFRRRMTAALVATAVVVAGYMMNSLSDFVSGLKGYNRLSPMYYYSWGEPLLKRVHWDNIVYLCLAGVAFYVLALIAFQRREVMG